MIADVLKNNPTDVTLLTSAGHNMFSTTHEKMYLCFPKIEPKKVNFLTVLEGTQQSNSTFFHRNIQFLLF